MGGGTVDGGVGDRQRMGERMNEWGRRTADGVGQAFQPVGEQTVNE